AIDQASPAVPSQCGDQSEVCAYRVLEKVLATVDLAFLLAFGELSAHPGRRVEGADTGAGSADAFGQVPLRHEFELDLAVAVEAVENPRVVLAREGADNLAHPPCCQERRQAGVAVARVV